MTMTVILVILNLGGGIAHITLETAAACERAAKQINSNRVSLNQPVVGYAFCIERH